MSSADSWEASSEVVNTQSIHLFSTTSMTTTTTTTTTHTLSPPQLDNCILRTPFDAGNDLDANTVTAVICALYFFFGIFCAFFGYRCFKGIMFLTGFIFASVIVYLICLEENVLPVWANTLIAVIAGLLFGLITMLVQYVGLFMLGFHGGLLLGLVGLVVADVARTHLNDVEPSHSPWISVGVILASGLVVSLANLYFQKSLTIICSALYGGAIIATVLDYFLEDSIMLMWIWDKVRVNESLAVRNQGCWFSWLILASWPLAMLLGVITQSLATGKGIYHEQQFVKPPNNSSRSAAAAANKSESREERKQRKYRYLYQVRTCHGDVISQPIAKKYVHHVNEDSNSYA